MKNKLYSLTITILLMILSTSLFAVDVSIVMPLKATDAIERSNYQTNERIEVSVIRKDNDDIPAGIMNITLTSDNNSTLSFDFPVLSVKAIDGIAAKTEIVYLNGYLLAPGKYTLTTTVNGVNKSREINVYSHIRNSTYKTIWWWGPNDDAGYQLAKDFNINIFLGGTGEKTIEAELDILGLMVMGGAHQHDMKLTNDWSDPNVYIGAMQRGIDRTFPFRTMPNAIGSHLHDEPGLTWSIDPVTEEFGPLEIKQQQNAYLRAFNKKQPHNSTLDINNPEDFDTWKQITEFRVGFMEALWKNTNEQVQKMKPGFLGVTQSMYGWWAMYSGYYFNIARQLPVYSGHGGYDDNCIRDMHPSYTVEISIPRQLDKPVWFLPMWGVASADIYKAEQYMSFITGIQGVATPPHFNIPSSVNNAVKESNLIMQKYGTIFATPAYTSQDIAILYSKSNQLFGRNELEPREVNGHIYLATKMLQFPTNFVLEEDILDGTLANNHQVLLIAALDYLDPAVISSLEQFIDAGGHIYMPMTTKIHINGAVILNADPMGDWEAQYDEVMAITDLDVRTAERIKVMSFKKKIESVEPYMQALKIALTNDRIIAPLQSSVNTIAVGRQVRGDFDYIMAVNFTPLPDYEGVINNGIATGLGGAIPTTTDLTITRDNGRAIYDAINHTQIAEARMRLAGSNEYYLDNVAFGGGDMKIYVLTERPIGGVQIGTASISNDFTRDSNPIRLKASAMIVDTNNRILSGSAPLQIVITDSLGKERFNIYRATEDGVCTIDLPLAANDANGTWTIQVTELISGTSDTMTFNYKTANNIGATAGLAPRAAYITYDEVNIYNFFRNVKDFTVVYGSGEECLAAANRIKDIFTPYNLNITLKSAEEANSARPLTEEELFTWCGNFANGMTIDSEGASNPQVVGYDVPGSVVLIGNARNNPLIAFLVARNVLPYNVTADFPGVGNGMLAWNTLTLGHDVETIIAFGNDEQGLNEAIGNMFTIGIGLHDLNPWVMPAKNNITPAN